MSRDTGTYGGREAWDDGPPGAETDYAYPGYTAAAPAAYKYGTAQYASDPRYAHAYQSSHYPGYSNQYPASGSSHYPPPPPPPTERYTEYQSQRPRRSRSRSVESRSYDAKRRRSRSRSFSPERRCRARSPERPSRHRSPSTPRRPSRRHRSQSSFSSDDSSSTPSRHNSGTRRKSLSKRRRDKSPEEKEKKKSGTKPKISHRSRESREKDHGKSRREDRTPERVSHHRRERSFTPPKSYKPRARSSSTSASSRSASIYRSHSTSHSRSPVRRLSSSRSPSLRSSHSKDRSRSKSRLRDDDTDSDTSSRGRFSGYDRKRYFRKLKEKLALEQQLKDQDMDNSGSGETGEASGKPPGAVEPASVDVDSVQYGDPPPVEGVNFEDLPPPPEELFRPGPARRLGAPPVIRNDGSFLEMFKRMQEETKRVEEASVVTPAPEAPRKPALPFIGKRRGGRVLKTGIVKKTKAPVEPTDTAPKDAWSLYMQEVKKYRETSCEEERKTRPLVK